MRKSLIAALVLAAAAGAAFYAFRARPALVDDKVRLVQPPDPKSTHPVCVQCGREFKSADAKPIPGRNLVRCPHCGYPTPLTHRAPAPKPR